MHPSQLSAIALAGLFVAAAISNAAPSADDIAKAQKAVEEKIQELKGPMLPVRYIADEAVTKAFPNYLIFAANTRQYPVAVLPPAGSKIKPQNVFIVPKDGKVEHLIDKTQLEKFFKDNLPSSKDDAALKTAAHAWMAISPEFMQDGFYKFKIVEDATKVTPEKTGKKVTGQVVVMAGGNGEITSSLIFDEAGKLVSASDAAKVKPGPRPICQATKLLDADSIVRKMAEQDLLYMGRAAHGYLMEQRARAAPELQQAIDRLWQRIEKEDR
jgi:hypothetical protein